MGGFLATFERCPSRVWVGKEIISMPIFIRTVMLILLLFFLIMLLSIAIADRKRREAFEQLLRSEKITIGMAENMMLSIMGGNYTRSLLKDNVTKYEWRISASILGYHNKGLYSRSYFGTRSVSIYVKDGLVQEVRCFNLH